MQKICPLYAMGEMIAKTIIHDDYDEENALCDGRMCAWYSDHGKCCSIVGAGASLPRPRATGSPCSGSPCSGAYQAPHSERPKEAVP